MPFRKRGVCAQSKYCHQRRTRNVRDGGQQEGIRSPGSVSANEIAHTPGEGRGKSKSWGDLDRSEHANGEQSKQSSMRSGGRAEPPGR